MARLSLPGHLQSSLLSGCHPARSGPGLTGDGSIPYGAGIPDPPYGLLPPIEKAPLCRCSPLQPHRGHGVVVLFLRGSLPPCPSSGRKGFGVLLGTDGGGGRLPYASPPRTRSASSDLPDRASLRPSVFKAPRRAPHPFLISIPSDRAVFRRTPEVAAAAARSPPRSGCRRHHCAPRLASCLSHTGPGSRELPARTTRR